MVDSLPLYPFFERLRKNDFPLGIDDYKRLLEGLRLSLGLGIDEFNKLNEAFLRRYLPESDFDTELKPAIFRVCKLLWLKPDQSTQLFEEIFNATFNLDAISFEAANKVPSPPEMVLKKNKHHEDPGPQAPMLQSPRPAEGTPPLNEPGNIAAPESTLDDSIRVRIDLGTRTPDELRLSDEEVELDQNKFLFTTNYFPIDRRKIQQNLRAYPSFRNFFSTTEVDFEATVDNTSKKGFFEKVIYKRMRVSIAQFVFLIDSGDSMVAFRQLALAIKTELEKAFNSKETPGEEVAAWYFNPTSAQNLYADRACTKGKALDKVIPRLSAKDTTVIFFGDAGAAATVNDRRLVNTVDEIIESLNSRTRKIAWINPLPKDRWQGTAAEKILETVAMFEANESGIKSAIDYLRGASVKLLKPVNPARHDKRR